METLLQSAFELAGTPMTWLEVLAFVLSILMVFANMRQSLWGWPLAALSSAAYGVLFFHGKLYGEAALQLFFIAMALWGFLQWWQGRAQVRLTVRRMTRQDWAWSLGGIVLGWPLLALVLARFTDSPVPYWDALPTVASVVATVQLGRKFIENWAFWVAINAVSILLFGMRGYWLTVALYTAFIPLSFAGWRAWAREGTPAAST